jgi:predicted phosphoribosyltransferase
VFRDRREAGQLLAQLLLAYREKDDVIVLGLPRGGIPVAWEVAAALGAPLDAFVVRKLGAPGHELEPLEVTSPWLAGETPETYPTGL